MRADNRVEPIAASRRIAVAGAICVAAAYRANRGFRRGRAGPYFGEHCAQREPPMTNLAVTDELFFERTGMEPRRVEAIVGEALAGMDDGELFLEYSQSESVALDDGRIKSAAFDTTQGFGLRAVAGEAAGYAHASEILRGGDPARRRDGAGGRQRPSRTMAEPPPGTNRSLYTDLNPLGIVDLAAKTRLLAEIDAYARSRDPRVRQVMASLSGVWQAVQIIRADGRRVADIRPLVRLNVAVVVGEGDRMETGSLRRRAAASPTIAISTPRTGRQQVDEALRQALVNLGSVPAPAGEMTVVLGPGWPGVMLHEAVGHGLEGDFNRKKTSAFSGLIGQRVAAKGVTVVDDGTLPDRRGSLTIDDEGTPSNYTVLIEDGILKGYMQDRHQRAADGRDADRQRPAPELCPRADAAHDQHLHAGRRPRPAGDHRLGQARALRGQFRRRQRRHHLGQVRLFGLGGLPDRGRQGRSRGQGRDPDRQRPRRDDQDHDDRQRSAARRRGRHLRQGRPGRAGRRRPADLAHGRPDRRRHRA